MKVIGPPVEKLIVWLVSTFHKINFVRTEYVSNQTKPNIQLTLSSTHVIFSYVFFETGKPNIQLTLSSTHVIYSYVFSETGQSISNRKIKIVTNLRATNLIKHTIKFLILSDTTYISNLVILQGSIFVWQQI